MVKRKTKRVAYSKKYKNHKSRKMRKSRKQRGG